MYDKLSCKQVMQDIDKDKQITYMNLKMKSIYSNSIRELGDKPDKVKPIGCKYLYKRKKRNGWKSRDLKIQTSGTWMYPKEGIDYKEIFSTFVMLKSLGYSYP